jgi:hypothetical protein
MLVPSESLNVEQTDAGWVATTALVEGVRGEGRTERAAVRHLDHQVREYLRSTHLLGLEIPPEFRTSPRMRALLITLFIVIAIGGTTLAVLMMMPPH